MTSIAKMVRLAGPRCGVAIAIALAACARIGPAGAPEPRGGMSPYEQAVALFDTGDFASAEVILRRLAATCASGDDGKHSLLLLSAMWLEPRNTRANPDSAAALAAHVLSLPDVDRLERTAARSLYVLALELGAGTSRAGDAMPVSMFARSFSRCDEPVPASNASLPAIEHEPLAATVRRLERQRDSLATRAKELQTELQTAQAEIQRIRRLLGGRDTTTRKPPQP